MSSSMTDAEWKLEARKHRALERLGTNDPRCCVCGEGNWECLEAHHPAGQKHIADLTVTVCRNCHRKQSVRQDYFPTFDPDADPVLAAIGYFLLGLANLFRDILEKLEEFGLTLIARSTAGAA